MPLSLKSDKRQEQVYTHCKVGTIPLTPSFPGVAAGVVGVTPLPLAVASVPFCNCCPFWNAPIAPFAWGWPSFSEGGVKSPAPPGKDNEPGEVKAVAWVAVEGWVVRVSILARLKLGLGDLNNKVIGNGVLTSRQPASRKVRTRWNQI